MTLTDGQSHGIFSGNARLVDRKINKVFDISNNRTYGHTFGILDWIKQTTGVNTIGFYLRTGQPRDLIWDAQKFCGTKTDTFDYDIVDIKKKEYNQLSTTFTDGHYYLAILINQKKMKLNYNEDELQAEVGANRGQLKRALVKAGNNKMKQRVIINQFVGQMAV